MAEQARPDHFDDLTSRRDGLFDGFNHENKFGFTAKSKNIELNASLDQAGAASGSAKLSFGGKPLKGSVTVDNKGEKTIKWGLDLNKHQKGLDIEFKNKITMATVEMKPSGTVNFHKGNHLHQATFEWNGGKPTVQVMNSHRFCSGFKVAHVHAFDVLGQKLNKHDHKLVWTPNDRLELALGHETGKETMRPGTLVWGTWVQATPLFQVASEMRWNCAERTSEMKWAFEKKINDGELTLKGQGNQNADLQLAANVRLTEQASLNLFSAVNANDTFKGKAKSQFGANFEFAI